MRSSPMRRKMLVHNRASARTLANTQSGEFWSMNRGNRPPPKRGEKMWRLRSYGTDLEMLLLATIPNQGRFQNTGSARGF